MTLESDFEEVFESRRQRWLENLDDLYRNVSPQLLDPFGALPSLVRSIDPSKPLHALRWSILTLWLEAVQCFVLGQFQASILASGAVVERILKLEYQESKGPLPSGVWTLGKCTYKLDLSGTRISPDLLHHARECVDPKNDRSHALLEHQDPTSAYLGGDRGVYLLRPNAYLIEPFRGEARRLVTHTWSLLRDLYSPPTPGSTLGDA